MIRPIVYIETTIPSFYHEIRQDNNSIAFRGWTRDWWDNRRGRYEVRTSQGVVDEASAGEYPTQAEVLDFLGRIPLLSFAPEITEIAAYYIDHRVMPDDPSADAFHLATASFHKCDFLLTWNCRHLANANKFALFREINSQLGLFTPTIVTPLELLEDTDET